MFFKVFVALSFCAALKCSSESPWLTFLICAFGMNAFYVAHWQTYITGTLKFGK